MLTSWELPQSTVFAPADSSSAKPLTYGAGMQLATGRPLALDQSYGGLAAWRWDAALLQLLPDDLSQGAAGRQELPGLQGTTV